MAHSIIWTAEADNDLFIIASYLRENWSENSASKFINNINRKIEQLSEMPSLGRVNKKDFICSGLTGKMFFSSTSKKSI